MAPKKRLRRCLICPIKSEKNLFKFPSDPYYYREWLKACNVTSARISHLICINHFKQSDIMAKDEVKTTLWRHAIPSLNLPEETKPIIKNHDHDAYCIPTDSKNSSKNLQSLSKIDERSAEDMDSTETKQSPKISSCENNTHSIYLMNDIDQDALDLESLEGAADPLHIVKEEVVE